MAMLLQQRRIALGAPGQRHSAHGTFYSPCSTISATRPKPVVARVHACATCGGGQTQPDESAHDTPTGVPLPEPTIPPLLAKGPTRVRQAKVWTGLEVTPCHKLTEDQPNTFGLKLGSSHGPWRLGINQDQEQVRCTTYTADQGLRENNSAVINMPRGPPTSVQGAHLRNNVVSFPGRSWQPPEDLAGQQQSEADRLALLARPLSEEWLKVHAALLRVMEECAAMSGLRAIPCCMRVDGAYEGLPHQQKELLAQGWTMVYVYYSQNDSIARQGQFKVGFTRGTVEERLEDWDKCGHKSKVIVAWLVPPMEGVWIQNGDRMDKIHAGWWLEQLMHAALGRHNLPHCSGLWAGGLACATCGKKHGEWFHVCHPTTGISLLTHGQLFVRNNPGFSYRLDQMKREVAKIRQEGNYRFLTQMLATSWQVLTWCMQACVLGGDIPMLVPEQVLAASITCALQWPPPARHHSSSERAHMWQKPSRFPVGGRKRMLAL